MNITALRPRFIRYLEPVADVFVRLRITPNQISLIALLPVSHVRFSSGSTSFSSGALLLLLSAVFDLVDGSVARKTGAHTNFGAVFDWIVDKYVDALALLGIGLAGIPIVSEFFPVPPLPILPSSHLRSSAP